MAELSKIISQHVDVLHLPRSLLLEQLMGQQQENVKMKEEVIKEDCPKCKHPEMSYHTKQLRGLDEGQTIFYTCLNPKCGHNYTVNS